MVLIKINPKTYLIYQPQDPFIEPQDPRVRILPCAAFQVRPEAARQTLRDDCISFRVQENQQTPNTLDPFKGAQDRSGCHFSQGSKRRSLNLSFSGVNFRMLTHGLDLCRKSEAHILQTANSQCPTSDPKL